MSQSQLAFVLAGAATAIVVGWVANWVRAGTESRQWEREKLHDAYENFLAAHEHMLTFFGRSVGTKQADLAIGWRDVSERTARMKLLAPSAVVTAAENLVTALGTYQFADAAFKTMAARTQHKEWDKGLAETYTAVSKQHTEAKATFIQAARADLLQRTRPWIAPKVDRLRPSVESWLKRFPGSTEGHGSQT